MRCLVVFVLALGSVVSPLSVRAQAGEERTAEEPELQPDDVGVEVAPNPLEIEQRRKEAKRRVRGGGIGVGLSIGVMAGGFTLIALAPSADDLHPAVGRFTGGILLILVGTVAMGFSAAALNSGHKELKELQELRQAHYGRPRRAQWDLARSRLVF